MTDPPDHEALAAELGDRPFRFFPAILSAAAEAQSWARRSAADGAVVVPGYEAAPRGRAGRPWDVDPEHDVSFSQIVRPGLSPEREGWLYAAATTALAEVVGPGAEIEWPDTVTRGDRRVAHVGVHAELGPARVDWAVITVLLRSPDGHRAAVVARVAEALDRSLAREPESVLEDLRSRCATLGGRVRALMIPMGPGGPRVEGTAADLKDDGALVIVTPAGGRIAVRPQHLGELEPMDG